MGKKRQEVFYDKRRDLWVGKFWRLKEAGKYFPPTRDLIENYIGITQHEIDEAFIKAEKELLQQQYGSSEAEPLLFSEASWKWSESLKNTLAPRSLVEYKRAIKKWLNINGDHSISLINSESHALFLEKRLSEKVSDATIQKDQRHLNVFFVWLYNEGLINKEIKFKKRRVEEKDPEIYTEEELEGLFDLLKGNKQWVRIFMLARYAVMRSGEIWALPLERINLKEKIIVVSDVEDLNWTVKTRTMRKIPIGKSLYPFLKEDLANRKPGERWFLDNGSGHPAYWSSWALTQIFRRRCQQLGIKGPKPLHGIRSMGITKMLLESGRPELVAQIAGHSEAVMFKYYARITQENSRGVVDLL